MAVNTSVMVVVDVQVMVVVVVVEEQEGCWVGSIVENGGSRLEDLGFRPRFFGHADTCIPHQR